MNFASAIIVTFYFLTLIIISKGLQSRGSELEQFIREHELDKCSANADSEIRHCLEPILKYANKIQKQNGSRHFSAFHQNSNAIRKMCSLYTNFQDCTKETKCSSFSIKAVDASYGYMCGLGFKIFEKYAECFAKVENHSGYIKCKEAANNAMDEEASSSRDQINNRLDEHFETLCSVMDEYLRCCRPFVNNKCGAEAWSLVSKITADSLRVTMPKCDLSKIIH